MKLVRFQYKQDILCGVLEDDYISVISGQLLGDFSLTDHRIPLAEVTLLPPLTFGKIIGLSNVNYYSAMEKRGLPLPSEITFFIKPTNTVIGNEGPIVLPSYIKKVIHEIELAIVIGKQGKYIPEDRAGHYILGYTLANDITALDFILPNTPIGKAKSFDTFTPIGPCIETDIHWSTLDYKLYVSEELRQHAFAADMIFKPSRIVSVLSSIMTLEPGDVILTGTPYNNNEFRVGDTLTMECEQIGKLVHNVI